MRAITLTQPWATLVAIGAKKIETRSWSASYYGPLLIHAGQGLGPVHGTLGLGAMCSIEPFRSVLHEAGYTRSDMLPRGAIVAVTRVMRVTATDTLATHPDLTAQERAFGDYSPGRYAWILGHVAMLATPVPCRGAQGLWTVPPDVADQVGRQLP